MFNINTKIKIYIGSFQEAYILYINILICMFLGIIIRYTIWFLLNPKDYNEYFGFDWDILYIINNPYYLVIKIPLSFVAGFIGGLVQYKFMTFYKECKFLKIIYLSEIEWFEMNNNNKVKEYEINNGDIMGMIICNEYISQSFPYFKREKAIEELYKCLNLGNRYYINWDEINLYLFINSRTKYNIKHLKTIKILKKKMLNYLENDYFKYKSSLRINKYKEELIKRTWHPERLIEWCEPNLFDDY